MSQKTPLLDHPFCDWPSLLSEGRPVPAFRARQVSQWIFRHNVPAWGEMKNLPEEDRRRWSERWDISLPVLREERLSGDGTRKLLLELSDGARIESVLIPRDHRATLCVSSQVGCGIGCRFCRTADMGLVRNLTVSEILGQVRIANYLLSKRPFRDTSKENADTPFLSRVNHLVFMGMGEPLANFDSLVRALSVLTSPEGFELSPRRITVSTSGLAGRIRDLGDSGISVNLAVSLSAPTEDLREDLMPISRHHPIRSILAACRDYPLRNRQRITFEYVLLGGVNDRDDQARDLARLLAPFRSKVNLIPFNPYPGSPYLRPDMTRVLRFQEILLAKGVTATLRTTRGEDILGACGQLALPLSTLLFKESSTWKTIDSSTPV